MIIWSGRGYLGAAATFGVCLVTNYVVDENWGQGFYSSHLWIVGLAVTGGGLLSAAIGFGLKPHTERELTDPATDERVVIQFAADTLFFIPLHWAGCVIAMIGVGTVLYDLVL